MKIRHVGWLCVSGALLSSTLPGASQSAVPQPAVPSAPAVPAAQPPQPPPAPVQAPPPVVRNVADLPPTVIAWDSSDKSETVESGEMSASFSFSFTNVSQEPVTIDSVHTSCGCTTADLPAMPWVIPAGANDVLKITMNLAGKSGTVIKSVSISTDKGLKNLLVRSVILSLPTATGMPAGSREQNQLLALSDRQAVFKGDCATCHSAPAADKMGADLYAAVCGVCHEAEHRATMVPDLKVAKQERNAEYWTNWITNGKQGSLMPAFTKSAGGILSEEQIASLVEYLLKTMPAKPAPASAQANVPAPAGH